MKKLYIVILFLIVVITDSQAQIKSKVLRDSILNSMDRVAQWQIAQFSQGMVKSPETGWENAALYTGMVALKKVNNRSVYDRFLYGIGEKNNWDMGPNRFFADDYCVAQMYIPMYLEHHEPKVIAKWKLLADSIVAKRYDESLTLSPGLTHREWAWCDALYMGPTSLAMLSSVTKNPKYLDKADSLWWKTSAFLYDKQEHLYYRDSRFFDMKEKNGAKIFWSRGNGWVIAGLTRMMDQMPKNFKSRKRYEQQFREIAERITKLQQADGSWHASLLDPETYNEKETSGTGFYCYALAWGINKGLLSKQQYLPVIERAWRAMTSAVHADGKLGFVQNVGSGPIKADYNSTNTYGVGAFLLAGTELYKLYK